MRLVAVQLFTLVGQIDVNFKRIQDWIQKAKELSADAVLFPECVLPGYLPMDDLFNTELVLKHQQFCQRLQTLSRQIDILVGGIDEAPLQKRHRYFNTYFHFSRGALAGKVHKTRLPNDDIFCDSRYFIPNPQPGTNSLLTLKHRFTLGVGICEDMWHDAHLYEQINRAGSVDLMICPSASPYSMGKPAYRKQQIRRIIKTTQKPFLFLNQVAGYDGVLFDGHSYLFSRNQTIIGQLEPFEEQALVLDFDKNSPNPSVTVIRSLISAKPVAASPKKLRKTRMDGLVKALTFGIRNFTLGSGCKKAVICVSGGIDSTLVLLLTKRALGAKACQAIIMPSPYTHPQASLDAVSLCQAHGIDHLTIPIQAWMVSFQGLFGRLFKTQVNSVVFQNIQARLRGLIAMGISNQTKALLIGTSNKSELAMGYATLYGDLCAGLLPIGDLLKTQVYLMTQYLIKQGDFVPPEIVRRPPSAELTENQKDEDDLPPYNELDSAILKHLQKELSNPIHMPETHPTETERRLGLQLQITQFKRKQAAPILKISSRDLGRGRQMIISGGHPDGLESLRTQQEVLSVDSIG
jgi:NAD+ synthase (glutamine-hydrolysing)